MDITAATEAVVWQPTARLSTLRFRSQLIQIIRNFFADRGVLEVRRILAPNEEESSFFWL